MRKRQDDWSSMSFGELPAHLGIASTLHTLRVRLDAPVDLALTQWQLAPLHTISPRLTGCTWQIVGCLVPVTDDPPAYPFMDNPDDPLTRLQAWLWRTSQSPRQLYSDLRWHPMKGRFFKIAGPGSTHRAALLQVWGWLHATDAHARGRRSEAAYVVDGAELERRLISAFQQLEKHGQPATRPRVAKALSWSRGTLKNYCDRFDINFDNVRQRVRDDQAP